MKRLDQILIGILVVQIVVGVVVFWPRPVATAGGEPIFPDLEAEDVVALEIMDDAGERLSLAKETGTWVLTSAGDYPAKPDKISSILEGLLNLDTSRLVTRTDDSHKQLQVDEDDYARRVELKTSSGELHTLYLGSSPNYGATHFRLAGQSETYLTDELTTWDVGAAASAWVDTAYLNYTVADVRKMTLENENGTFIFVRDDEDAWTLEGLRADETLAATKVTATIRQAAAVNMVEPLGREALDEYGMEEPSAVATVELADQTITLSVGAQDPEDDSYVVISSESPYYVRVSQFSVQNLVEYARDDFLELPPTPEGEDSDT